MDYSIASLETLVQRFCYEEKEDFSREEIAVLLSIHSIGRDGIAVNGEQMYRLRMADINEIYISRGADEAQQELIKYARSVSEIIGSILPYMLECCEEKSQYVNQLLENTLAFHKFLLEGMRRLQRFPE